MMRISDLLAKAFYWCRLDVRRTVLGRFGGWSNPAARAKPLFGIGMRLPPGRQPENRGPNSDMTGSAELLRPTKGDRMSTRVAEGSDFRRLAGLAGVVSAILLVIGLIAAFAQGAPPALDGKAADVANYFGDNQGLAKMTALLNFLPILTLPILFVAWYSSRRDGGSTGTATGAGSWGSALWARTALIGFIVLGVFSTIQGAAAFAITLGVKDDFEGSPAIAGALFDFYNALAAATALVMALFLWSIANADGRDDGSVRDRGPSWLKPALYIGVAASLLSFLAPFLEIDVLAMAGLIAYLVFIVWVAVTGMGFLKGADGSTTTTT